MKDQTWTPLLPVSDVAAAPLFTPEEQAVGAQRVGCPPKWGQHAKAGDAERETSGRFRTSILCDCCSKPMGDLEKEGNHFTDGEVCGSSDGPGFFLCYRVRCQKAQEGLDVEARRALFTAGRARNEGRR